MFTNKVVGTLEYDCGKFDAHFCKFVVDQCDASEPLQSVLASDLSNQCSLIAVDVTDAKSVVEHYQQCKSRAPKSTSACYVLPIGIANSSSWRKLLRNTSYVLKYGAGELSSHSGGQLVHIAAGMTGLKLTWIVICPLIPMFSP